MHAESDLQFLDGIARRFLALNDRVEYRVARTPDELEAVFRLRCRTVIERGWARPEDYPDGLERDRYDDERTVQVMALRDGMLVGTGRIVLPAPGRLLPGEEAFGIAAAPRGQVVEVGRAIVDAPFQDLQQPVFLGLLGTYWRLTREHGLNDIIGEVTPGMIRLYRFIGFEPRLLAPFRTHWGEERALIALDVEASVRTLAARSDLFWKRLAQTR